MADLCGYRMQAKRCACGADRRFYGQGLNVGYDLRGIRAGSERTAASGAQQLVELRSHPVTPSVSAQPDSTIRQYHIMVLGGPVADRAMDHIPVAAGMRSLPVLTHRMFNPWLALRHFRYAATSSLGIASTCSGSFLASVGVRVEVTTICSSFILFVLIRIGSGPDARSQSQRQTHMDKYRIRTLSSTILGGNAVAGSKINAVRIPLCLDSGRRVHGESLYDRTLGVLRVRVAVGNQTGKFLAQVNKLADASVNEAQLVGGEFPRGAARASRLKREQACDLRECKSHRLSPLDEAQTVRIRLGVPSDAAQRPRRFARELQALVVANRLDVHAGGGDRCLLWIPGTATTCTAVAG